MKKSRRKITFVLILYSIVYFIYFIPVLFSAKRNLLLDPLDHFITYVRMVSRANWIRSGIVPLWDPATFSGLSFIDTVPSTHVLNLQAWVMALVGNKVGYEICVMLFFISGSMGVFLLLHYIFRLRVLPALAGSFAASMGPFAGNTFAGIFVYVPFGSFFLFWMIIGLKKSGWKNASRPAAMAALAIAVCGYTQEPRFLEFIAHSSWIFGMVYWLNTGRKKENLQKIFTFLVLCFFFSFVLLMPLLIPMISEVFFHYKRLGSGVVLPPIWTIPVSSYIPGAFISNLLPVNSFILQDDFRAGKPWGMNLYPDHVHILFIPAMITALSKFKSFTELERSFIITAVLLKTILFVYLYIPGFFYVWSLLFKTGRFLESDISFLFCIISVFIILRRAKAARPGGQLRILQSVVFYIQLSAATAMLLGMIIYYISSYYNLFNPLGNIGRKIEILNYYGAMPRMPYLITAYMMLILILAGYNFPRVLRQKKLTAFYLMLLFAPVLLTKGYWPFNAHPHRSDVMTKDRQFLQSMTILDRQDSVDFHAYPDIKPEEWPKLIPYTSHRSLEWASFAFPPATMEFIHHFVPMNIYKYLTYMYRNDPAFERSYQNRIFFNPNDNNLFHALGIKYFFSELPRFGPPFRNLGLFGEYYVYENEKAMPRAYFAQNIRIMKDQDSVLQELGSMPYQEFKKTALVGDHQFRSRNYDISDTTLQFISYTPNLITIQTSSRSDEFLILTDTFDKHWRATIDGAPAEITAVNYLFRGIAVPPGRHSIVFTYEYKIFIFYVVISAAAAFCLIFIGISRPAAGRKRRRLPG